VRLTTKLLNQAFEKASELPDDLQDQLAQELLEEIEGESRWDTTLEGSQDRLERLAEKALQEYRAGKTKEIGLTICEVPTFRGLHLLLPSIPDPNRSPIIRSSTAHCRD
jgi:hypothetical protein